MSDPLMAGAVSSSLSGALAAVTTDQLAWGMIGTGVLAAAVLLAGVAAPYGR